MLILGACAAPAGAQERRWEIEGYGGIVAARTASAGSQTLPPPGAPLVTSNPTFPTHQVPSWFFGDGTSVLNGANAELGGTGRITPLDAVFAPLGSKRVGAVGVRLRRRLSERMSMEISVDALTGPDDRISDLSAAVETSRDSFKTAFTGLLRTGPFAGVVVDATGASATEVQRRDTAVTLALSARFPAWGSFVPYATFGGGVMAGSGSLPSASLEGRYRFSILGEVPIDEADRVSLRYTRGTALVAVLGGGLQRDFSSQLGPSRRPPATDGTGYDPRAGGRGTLVHPHRPVGIRRVVHEPRRAVQQRSVDRPPLHAQRARRSTVTKSSRAAFRPARS